MNNVQPQQKQNRGRLIAVCLVPLCLGSIAFLLVSYQKYNALYTKDISLARTGIQQLQAAGTLLEALSRNPFDAKTTASAQSAFANALTHFSELGGQLSTLPAISTALPLVGNRVQAAQHLVPIAIEMSQVGVIACTTLNLLASRLQNSAESNGLTVTDVTRIVANFQQISNTLHSVSRQINALSPGDLQLDSRIGSFVARFHKDMPMLTTRLNEAEQILSVAPALLGIGTPANYLIEVLDSTELRPGGGFIGNYGIATFAGGKLTTTSITDTYLLDTSFVATGHQLSYPAAYRWFDLAPQSWSLRDSNLDADFPTAANDAEWVYVRESGYLPLTGVIAITPALVARLLAITGPIAVPEYHQTVTTQNLVDLIHYYQLGSTHVGSSLIPASDGKSSQRKHFIALLAEHMLARIHTLPSSAFPKLAQVLVQSLRSKDVQVYFNLPQAQRLLSQWHLDGTIANVPGDDLFVVDANISANKANSQIESSLHDSVTIDAEGNAVHHTMLTYAWSGRGQVYGASLYRDYVRIYLPSGSILSAQQGWQPRGSSQAFGRTVWAGFFTLTYGQVRTITLTWTTLATATHAHNDWQYQYLLQRQAGSRWTLSLQIQLPPTCVERSASPPLSVDTMPGGQQITMRLQGLEADMQLAVNYGCQ